MDPGKVCKQGKDLKKVDGMGLFVQCSIPILVPFSCFVAWL